MKPSNHIRNLGVIPLAISLMFLIQHVAAAQHVAESEAELKRNLLAAGYSSLGASRLAEAHWPAYSDILDANPALAKRYVETFHASSPPPSIERLAIKHPDLVRHAIGCDHPSQVAELLMSGNVALLNTFTQYPHDWDAIARELARHGDALRSIPPNQTDLPVYVFLNVPDEESDYRACLASALIWTKNSDVHRTALLSSLARCSQRVRAMFRDDPRTTQAAFLSLKRFCDNRDDHDPFRPGVVFDFDVLLRFFSQCSASDMATRVGLQAVTYLTSDQFSPAVRKRLARVLLDGDGAMIRDIKALDGQYGLVDLLDRQQLRIPCLKAALAESQRNPAKLRQFTTLDDDALERQVGTASIGAWQYVPLADVAVKIYDGREITTFDAVMVGVDVATIAFPLAKGGVTGMRMVSQVSAKQLRDTAIKQAGKGASKRFAKEIAEMPFKQLRKQFPELLESTAKSAIRQELKKGGLDITKLMQYAWKTSGKRTNSFKYLTKLEPRVFMRSDRRIVFYPMNTATGTLLSEVVHEVAAGSALKQGIVVAKSTLPKTQAAVKRASEKLNAFWFAANDRGDIGAYLAKTFEAQEPIARGLK